MKLLEIKNNLIKLSYAENEMPILGRFIVLATENKSYVAQFINLKADAVNNYAIARLLFTFSDDGVVDNYDGSVPSVKSELSLLPSSELLDLLPIENPLKIGTLAQQEEILSVDTSIFENNFTVFVEKDSNKTTFISNCIRQLFQMREKSIIIDNTNLFENFEKIEIGRDFKLPLNSKIIDYIFDYELADVNPTTKAIIQDIFYAVQQYIKSLDFEFLPIDNFVNVVTNQYKETQMPELALLKNKLLKYRDANVFANTKEEVLALKDLIEQKNCSIVDIQNLHESLQKEAISFIHSELLKIDKYIYLFLPLTDGNSDKKLLKQIINNDHVFTTLLVSSSYQYAEELKQHAQNIIVFAPQSISHEFTNYNTFLNKLNPNECIMYGELTQGIPFIVNITDLDLDLTREDILGEKYQFIPNTENLQFVKVDEEGNKTLIENVLEDLHSQESSSSEEQENESIKYTSSIPVLTQPTIEVIDSPEEIIKKEEETNIEEDAAEDLSINEESLTDENYTSEDLESSVEDFPVEEFTNNPESFIENFSEENSNELEPTEDLIETSFLNESTDDEFTEIGIEDFESTNQENIPNILEDDSIYNTETEELTNDDLDFLDDLQQQQEESFNIDEAISAVDNVLDEDIVEDQPPIVPVYPAEEDIPDTDEIDFAQGDMVTHPRYGRGIIEKIINYGNKTLCSISFENVGRRLLDPTISNLTKI